MNLFRPKNQCNIDKWIFENPSFSARGSMYNTFGKEARRKVIIREPVRLAHSLFFIAKK